MIKLTDLKRFQDEVEKFVNERDWKQYHKPKALAEAISIEAAELLEHFLFKKDSYFPENREEFEDEIADVFIYLMSLLNTLKINDFTNIFNRKMEKNRKKYPIDRFKGEKYKKQ